MKLVLKSKCIKTGRNQTDSNSNETWLSGSSSLKTTVERHLKAIQSPLMSIGCQTGDKMHFLNFLGLIPLCARELSHTLQVAGSEGRCGGRTKVVWRHFCHARSPSASVLGPTLSPSTPQPIPVALQCPNAMPIPIFARTRHFACSPMH